MYSIMRFIARATAAGVISTLFTGKAEPFGLHFEGTEAAFIAAGLCVLSIVAFHIEGRMKRETNQSRRR